MNEDDKLVTDPSDVKQRLVRRWAIGLNHKIMHLIKQRLKANKENTL